MAASITGPLLYLPKIDGVDDIRAAGTGGLLAGEYGRLSPLSFHGELKLLGSENLLIEILLRNKNRELVESYLVNASILGFTGAVIATGTFDKRANMPMPVYDLDARQALRLALELRKEGKLRADFRIGVRAASGCEAACERAKSFVDAGADFIVVQDGTAIPGIEKSAVTLEETRSAS